MSRAPILAGFFVGNKWRCDMFKSLDIQKNMEVVGLDGKHVGTIDHLETADRIILSKDDPKAGGRQHLISIDWVDYVDQKVHLNKPSTKATSNGRRLPKPRLSRLIRTRGCSSRNTTRAESLNLKMVLCGGFGWAILI